MTDQFSLCFAEYKTQLQTLAGTTGYFPLETGRELGWQITEDDNVVFSGGDYFLVLRPGSFTQNRNGNFQENTWGVRTFLFMRYQEYEGLWLKFRAFRSAILELPDTRPMKRYGIYNQTFNAAEDAGFLRDGNGNYTNFVTQIIDCSISQRVLLRRAM